MNCVSFHSTETVAISALSARSSPAPSATTLAPPSAIARSPRTPGAVTSVAADRSAGGSIVCTVTRAGGIIRPSLTTA